MSIPLWSASLSPRFGLSGNWGLWRRYARSRVMGSSTVWGDIQSVWGMEYVRSCRMKIYHQGQSQSQGRWSKRVSPCSHRMEIYRQSQSWSQGRWSERVSPYSPSMWPPYRLLEHGGVKARLMEWIRRGRWMGGNNDQPSAIWQIVNYPMLDNGTSVGVVKGWGCHLLDIDY